MATSAKSSKRFFFPKRKVAQLIERSAAAVDGAGEMRKEEEEEEEAEAEEGKATRETYLGGLAEIDRCVFRVAVAKLESSFRLEDTNGFLEWLAAAGRADAITS